MRTGMTCREGVPLLMDYLEGTLSARDRSVVDRHVAGCRRCQGFVASYVETPRILRWATRERMPGRVSRELRRRLALTVGDGAAGLVTRSRHPTGTRRRRKIERGRA
jgi:anti-sigma factor RsiW